MNNSHSIMQVKNGTAAELAALNPILAKGEMVLESDTNKIKFGDGETRYNLLPSIGSGAGQFKYGLYTLSAAQTTNLAVGNHIQFDKSEGNIGGLSTGTGQANGIVTLSAGKTYKIQAGLHVAFAGSEGGVVFGIYDRTNNVDIGIRGCIAAVTKSEIIGFLPLATGVVKPEVDIQIEVRILILGTYGPNYIDAPTSNLFIEEVG